MCYVIFIINYYLLIEPLQSFSFVNNIVVYKALLIYGKGGKLITKYLL